MSYKAWKAWLKKLPWKYKWFMLVLLFRPLIDLTYDIEIFSSLNLLHIMGGLTFIIIVLLYALGKLTPKISSASSVSKLFVFWSVLLILNSALLLIEELSLERINIALKLTLPIYLYLFFRPFIDSKRNLDGTLQTILYSAIIPAFLLSYEIMVSPFRVARSRGIERIMGGYADVVSLGLFFLGITLISGYFFMERIKTFSLKKKNIIWLGLIISFCIVGLLNINHTASAITFIFLLLFLVFRIFKIGKRGKTIGIFVTIFSGLIIFQGQLFERMERLVATDVQVIKGEKYVDYALHGRVGRWRRHWDYFSNEISFQEKLVGVIGVKRPYMIAAGEHNDYLRILYATGYIGIIVYFAMLIALFERSRRMLKNQQFLVRGILLILLLMSFSTTPTFYNFINFLFIPILVYSILPQSIWKKKIEEA